MELPLQTRQHDGDPYRDAKRIVRLWPAPLRAESKIAFEFLCELATQERRREFIVSPVDVGAYQGHDAKAGRTALRNLHAAELIRVVDERAGPGRWLVYMNDPAAIAARIKLRLPQDAQLRLTFDAQEVNEDGTFVIGLSESGDHFGGGLLGPACATVPFPSPAKGGHRTTTGSPRADAPPSVPVGSTPVAVEAAAHPAPHAPWGAATTAHPAPDAAVSRTRNFGPSESIRSLSTSEPSVTSVPSEPKVPRLRSDGASGPAAHSAPHPPPDWRVERIRRKLQPGDAYGLGDVLGSRDFVDPERQAKIEAEIRWVLNSVRCPFMRKSPAVRAAKVVVDGYLPKVEIEQLIVQLNGAERRKELQDTRSRYFNGGLQRLFSRFGLDYQTCKPQGAAT